MDINERDDAPWDRLGRYSEVVFDRDELPSRCLIVAGAYSPGRKDVVRSAFDEWARIRGQWLRFSYAGSGGNEWLVVFNVYGGATTLEVLHLLRDGNARHVFFIGSVYAKRYPIGTVVTPVEAVDRAGLVLIDDPEGAVIRPDRTRVDVLKHALEADGIPYEGARIVSVPAVLHEIGHVKDFVERRDDIDGVEMEISTFYHFSRKLGLRSYALLYVSDNPEHDVISRDREVVLGRRKALKKITEVALRILA